MISFSLFSFLGEITQPTTPRRRSRLRVRADWNRHSRFLKSFSGNLSQMSCFVCSQVQTKQTILLKVQHCDYLQNFPSSYVDLTNFSIGHNNDTGFLLFKTNLQKSLAWKRKANTLFFASCWSLQLTQMKKIVKAKTE